MEKELKQINNFEKYFINEDGQVYSNFKRGLYLLKQQKASQSKKKYLQVRLFSPEQKGVLHYVHRLVWETFRGEIPEDLHIDHIDGDPSNNNINNLQLITPIENTKKYHRKETNYFRTKREEITKDYQELGSTAKVAEKWGCSPSTVWYVVTNQVLARRDGKFEYVVYDESIGKLDVKPLRDRQHRDEILKDYKELGSYKKVGDKWGISTSKIAKIINGQ